MVGVLQGAGCLVMEIVTIGLMQLMMGFFTEPDRTINIDWRWAHTFAVLVVIASVLSCLCFCAMFLAGLLYLLAPWIVTKCVMRFGSLRSVHTTVLSSADMTLSHDAPTLSSLHPWLVMPPMVRRLWVEVVVWLPALTAIACAFAAVGTCTCVAPSPRCFVGVHGRR
jgi:hypothetical protein